MQGFSFAPSLDPPSERKQHTACVVNIRGALCAVRKVGCFPPLVATGPRVLNSAPYSPCWYTRDFFCLMLATGPRVLNSALNAVLN